MHEDARVDAQHGIAGPMYSPCQGCRLLLPAQRAALMGGAMYSVGLRDAVDLVIPA